MAEEREGIPAFSGGSPDPFGLGFRIIVYKRQDGDRFGCDLRQCLVMSLNELLRHNRVLPQPPASRESGTPGFRRVTMKVRSRRRRLRLAGLVWRIGRLVCRLGGNHVRGCIIIHF